MSEENKPVVEETADVAKQEQNDNARPAYAGEVPDLSQYSTIFIGAPVCGLSKITSSSAIILSS